MKLKELYEKLYAKIFSVGFFKAFLKIPGLEKLLQYEIISYLFFGVMTTVVNFVVYGLAKLPFEEEHVLFTLFNGFDVKWIYIANAIAWFFAVLFAYITNKLFVFESRSTKTADIIRELLSFFGARILSFLIFEEVLFIVLTKYLSLNDWLTKAIVGVLVIIFNYVASKLVIFKKSKNKE